MTALSTNTISAPAPAAGLMAALKGAIARRAVYKRTLAELSGLSDRELSDIGISRNDIGHIAQESARSA